MIWPWSRPEQNRTAPADDAIVSAQHRLDEVKRRAPEVHEVTESLRIAREANHFTEKLHESLRRI